MNQTTQLGHLLIVSLGYTPLAHVSATRSTHMAQELTALGWDVSVLTVDWSTDPPLDPPSAGDCAQRALNEPSPRCLGIDGRRISQNFDRTIPESCRETESSALARRMATFRNILDLGPYRKWAELAIAAGEALHSSHPVDVIWAIHGDDSSHATAHALHQRLGVPWIADFKDPWDMFHSRLAVPIQRFATQRRLATAHCLTETCEAQAMDDQQRFKRPAHVVYSGFDRSLMESVEPEHPGPGFAISYVGAFGDVHDTTHLPGVVEELVRRGSVARYEIGIHQFGAHEQFSRVLEPLGCATMAMGHGRVERSRAFAAMRGSDMLMIFPITAGRGNLVGLKEIECFASGTPVLVFGEPLAELVPVIEACPQVHVVRSAAEGADHIEAEARARQQGQPSPTRAPVNPSAVDAFDWPVQAKRLSRVLREATADGTR
ncbi:hypothetical protein MK489_12460 [Myxococcota bacterium]|nr:hypothetical protein [Myxococcota bacterium]